MTISFTLIAYAPTDMYSLLSVPQFTIKPSELNWGTIGIACALAERLEAGPMTGWPEGLNPKSQTPGRLDLEAQYKALYESCKAAIEWQQNDCNPGSFSDAVFWVRVDFE